MSDGPRTAECERVPAGVDRQDQRHVARRFTVSRPCGGFTLLELILVLLVIGLGASLAAARLTNLRGSVGVDMAAQSLVDQARRARQLAQTSGHAVRLRIDPHARTLELAVLDGTKESSPTDGDDARIELSHSADEFTIAVDRSDGVGGTEKESPVDLVFSPDLRCEPSGIVTFDSPTHAAVVRIPAGAELPALVVAGNQP